MLPPESKHLRERLLCGGVALRHVERFMRELGEHYDDALRAELSRGLDRLSAERAAWLRLGSVDSLVQSALARPELRSKAARFPALVFGAGPVLVWLAAVVATFCVLRLLPQSSAVGAQAPGWLLEGARVLCTLYLRVLPVLLGVIVFSAAARRRLKARWPLAGAALVDLLAGTITVHVLGTAGLGVSSSLLALLLPFSDALGPRDLAVFAEGLLRAGFMLAVSAVASHATSASRAARAA